jgi:hypothetical protein
VTDTGKNRNVSFVLVGYKWLGVVIPDVIIWFGTVRLQEREIPSVDKQLNIGDLSVLTELFEHITDSYVDTLLELVEDVTECVGYIFAREVVIEGWDGGSGGSVRPHIPHAPHI